MWFPVTHLLLVGVAVATNSLEHEHAWEKGSEYQYLIRSRTVAGLDKLNEQYTGIQIKGVLTIQVKSPETLQAKFSNPQYAHIHEALTNGPETEISDQMTEYRPLPMSGKPFEIKLKHGVIRDLLVDRDVPTWELNILKGLVSQIQIDTQGENAIESKSMQIPVDENSRAMFSAMEDSVGGRCEVLYEITPLFDNTFVEERPDRVPFPNLRGDGQHLNVQKVKNYERCQQRQIYQHRLSAPLTKETLDKQDKVVSQFSTTQMIISGSLKRFTIQSTVMKSQISVKPEKSDSSLGTVHSIIRLTLVKKSKPSSPSSSMSGAAESTNLESTGSLIYTPTNPFSDSENRESRQPSVSWNSEQRQSSESSSSSSERDAHDRSSSSSSFSSEENIISNFESKVALHQAPNIPLLPFFVGYKGKSIQMSDMVDIVDSVQNLISQIANELQNSSETSSQYVLEKYLILKNLLRIMNYKQYTELVDRVSSENEKQDKQLQKDRWSVLRDAVAQAGTGPALLTTQNWLHTGKLEDAEAARLISQIPKNVRKPSTEYVKAFFDMIVHPGVLQQKHVNVSAPIALAELLRNGQHAWKSAPRRSSGPIKDNIADKNAVVDLVISYLADQLKSGFAENNSQKIQTYIVALGATGHRKIISVFEPYLENAEPASKFQRLLMVSSMSTLARIQPKLVGPILYKLYLNTLEDHEIRCLAVKQFIMTDPPMITLQRVARYTHFDESEQVSSAVKTTLESLTKTKQRELRNLANKARVVRPLLNPRKSDISFSRGYYNDFENWLVKGFSLQVVVSDDSSIPVFKRFSVNTIFDFLEQPTLEAGYAVSNIKQLINKIWQQSKNEDGNEEAPQKSRVEKLAQVLKIKPQQLSKLEGNVFLDSLYGLIFYPLDSNSFEKTSQMLQNLFRKDNKWDTTAFNNYEMIMSFPMETTGMPFIYSLESPTLLKLQTEWKKGEYSSTVNKGVINLVLGNRIQRRFGFVAPFEHQNYMAGIDKNAIMQIPVEYKVDMDQQSFKLMIRPNLPQTQMDSQFTLWHYSTIPFTTRQDIFNLQPLHLEKNTHQILTSKKYKTMVEKDLLSLRVESESAETEENGLGNIVAKLWQLEKLNSDRYKKLDILMSHEQAAKSEFRLNIVYDNMEVSANNANEQSQEIEPHGIPIPNKTPNSAERRNQIMQSLSKGLMSGKVHVIDISYNVPTSQKQKVLSAGMVRSNVDRKSKSYLYWNSQSSQSEETNHEACYLQETEQSPDTPLDFEYAMKNPPQDKLKATLLYGKNCRDGDKVVIVGTATRSDQLREALENSKIVKQCQEEIQKGNKAARVCQKAIEAAQVRDQFDIVVKAKEFVEKIFERVIDLWSHFWSKILVKPTNSSAEDVSIRINTSPLTLDEVPKVVMRTPRLDATFPHPMETTMETTMKTQELLTEVKRTISVLQILKVKDSCTLDKNQVMTFDKRTYPVTMGAVKHVLLTTYPQPDSDNRKHQLTIPEEMRVAVLAEDGTGGSKSVTVLLGNREVKLRKLDNHLEVTVAGEVVELSKHKSYQDIQDGKIVFEIVKLPDGSIEVSSDKYGISIVYDGERVQIKAYNKYRNNIRGLCGNYDSNPNNDFVTPKNCVLEKPEEFAATYALIQENSQGPVVENKRKAEQAECQELSPERHFVRNVISDKEAGRMSTEGKNWGYHQDNRKRVHGQDRVQDNKQSQEVESRTGDFQVGQNIVYRTRVVEEGDEICFTTRPVSTCREGTRPAERKSKKYSLYCQPRNEESTATKLRVENGANPDFTRKPATKSHIFQVPSACSAA